MTRAHSPADLSVALELLGAEGSEAIAVAGCTDLMAADHASGVVRPEVVDISRLPELRDIELKDGWLDMGAATTFSELRRHELVREHFPILAEVAGTIGGWQIQNRATLGGNIANASPAGDSLPVLLALDAELVLASSDGQRKVRYSDMHRGYRKTKLRTGELITRVRLPIPRRNMAQVFRKVGTREAQAISKVVIAFTVDVEEGRMHHARIAAGSVAAMPVRLRKAEKACEGKVLDVATADEVAAIARSEVKPIDDVRSTGVYRSHIVERIVRRMIINLG